MCVRACVGVYARARACVCVCVCVCVRACARGSVCACALRERARARACVCVFISACLRTQPLTSINDFPPHTPLPDELYNFGTSDDITAANKSKTIALVKKTMVAIH